MICLKKATMMVNPYHEPSCNQQRTPLYWTSQKYTKRSLHNQMQKASSPVVALWHFKKAQKNIS